MGKINALERKSEFMDHMEFEKVIMNKLLIGEEDIFKDLQRRCQNILVLSREFTGCGFFTTFDVQDYVPKYSLSGRIDDVAAEFQNSKDDACFILYVKDGKIDTLEGFTMGETWNYNYDQAKIVYCLPDRRRYEFK